MELQRAIYSASVEDRAIIDCLFEFQAMAPFPAKRTKPVVDFRVSTLFPQSASAYPRISSSSEEGPSIRMWSFVPLMYHNICFTTVRCSTEGFERYLETIPTELARSGLVATI